MCKTILSNLKCRKAFSYLIMTACLWIGAGTIFPNKAYAQGIPELIQALIQVGQNITQSIDGVDQTVKVDANTLIELLNEYGPSLQKIGNVADIIQGIIQSKNTQVIVTISGGIVLTALTFYIGDCVVRMSKTFYSWCCKKKPKQTPIEAPVIRRDSPNDEFKEPLIEGSLNEMQNERHAYLRQNLNLLVA